MHEPDSSRTEDRRDDAPTQVSSSAESRRSEAPLTIRENIENLSASLSDQIELLAQELRARWRAGKRVGVEALGKTYEQIAHNEEQLLDLIYHEILIREEFGEQPKLEDFTPRFPDLSERLQRLFAVHGALEDDAWDEELEAAFDLPDSDSEPTPDDSLVGNRGPSSTELNAESGTARKQWPRKSRDSRPVDPPPGYELLEEIGRGGMAVVFKARQEILNRTVAMKMLLAGGVASNEVLARIQQEARAVAQLQHPGIVQIYEVGTHRGLPYLSLEYVAGGTLHEWLGGRPLPAIDAARLIEQLARATHFAHERGIVHRDLKPANVLLTERPPSLQSTSTIAVAPGRESDPTPSVRIEPKISDFGLAKVLGSHSELTATGQVIGTPSYMAPEQAAGSTDDVSPAQDIYSLGAILYELLTGRPPFRGATLFDTLEQVRSNDPVPPHQLQPRIPRDIETICLKCLEKPPQRRYASALQLAEDLRFFQQGDSISARPAGAIERSLKLVRRYPTIAALVALVVLLTVGSIVGISREAARANRSEILAVRDRDRANDQWKRAEEQKAVADAERLKSAEQARIALMALGTADQQRKLAVTAQAKAEEQQQIAEQEKARAIDLQKQAEQRFDRTLELLRRNVDFASQLKNVPPAQTLANQMLDEALRLYDELAKEDINHPTLRRQRISALSAAAHIRLVRKETAKAEELMREALKEVDAGLNVAPNDVEMHRAASSVFWGLGLLYNSTNRPSDALLAWHRHASSHDVLQAHAPQNLGYITGKAIGLLNRAVSEYGVSQNDAAFASIEEAVRLVRGALARSPNSDWIKGDMSHALHDYSKALRGRKRIEESDKFFAESFALRQELHLRNPNDAGSTTMMARMLGDLGIQQRIEKSYAKSEENLRRAFELVDPIVRKYPDVYEHHRDRNLYMHERVRTARSQKDVETAFRLIDETTKYFEETRIRFSKDSSVSDSAADWHAYWGELLWEWGDYDAGRAQFRHALAASMLWVPESNEVDTSIASRLNTAAWRLAGFPTQEANLLPLAEQLSDAAIQRLTFPETHSTALYYRHTRAFIQMRRGKLADAQEGLLGGLRLMQPIEKRTIEKRTSDGDFVIAFRELPEGASATVRPAFLSKLQLSKGDSFVLTYYFLHLGEVFWRSGEKVAARNALRLVGDPDRSNVYFGSELRRMVSEVRALQAFDETPSIEPK